MSSAYPGTPHTQLTLTVWAQVQASEAVSGSINVSIRKEKEASGVREAGVEKEGRKDREMREGQRPGLEAHCSSLSSTRHWSREQASFWWGP